MNQFMALKSDPQQWCQQHYINYKAMLRAVEIRKQLAKYLRRFGVPSSSTKDTVAIRKCIGKAHSRAFPSPSAMLFFLLHGSLCH